MSDFNLERPYSSVASIPDAILGEKTREAMQRVYLWMTMGLFITAVMSFVTASTPLADVIAGSRWVFFGIIIAELILVIYLSARIQKMAPTTALMMFFVYSALNGLTISVILLILRVVGSRK